MCLRCDKNRKIDLMSGVCDKNHHTTYTDKEFPDKPTLRRNCVPKLYDKNFNEIRNKIGLAKNIDLKLLELIAQNSIIQNIEGCLYSETEIRKMKFAPITSVDMESSFFGMRIFQVRKKSVHI